MSWSSKNIFDPISTFFANVIAHAQANPSSNPSAAQATQVVQQVQANLSQAEVALQAGLPAAATIAANAILDMVPGGPAFEPIVDAFVPLVVNALEAALAARKAAPAPAVAVPGAH